VKRQAAFSAPDPAASYDTEAVAGILAHWRDVPGSLMPILHEIQDALGYIPPESVPQIARALNQSRAEVHGVISFYHDFRTAPGGRRTLKVCQAESCQAMGSRALTAGLEDRLGCRLGETTPDGEVTLEAVYCLGLCACSPAVMIDDEPMGRATVDTVTERLETAKGGAR
jgi:formate dehydrogenase subunit gamma